MLMFHWTLQLSEHSLPVLMGYVQCKCLNRYQLKITWIWICMYSACAHLIYVSKYPFSKRCIHTWPFCKHQHCQRTTFDCNLNRAGAGKLVSVWDDLLVSHVISRRISCVEITFWARRDKKHTPSNGFLLSLVFRDWQTGIWVPQSLLLAVQYPTPNQSPSSVIWKGWKSLPSLPSNEYLQKITSNLFKEPIFLPYLKRDFPGERRGKCFHVPQNIPQVSMSWLSTFGMVVVTSLKYSDQCYPKEFQTIIQTIMKHK